MKVLNFGSCNIDFVYSVDHIAIPGETVSTDCLEIFPGGKGLNQSIAAAKAGVKIYHAGCIGNDGGMLKDILVENGVDVSYLKEVDTKNGHAIIQVSRQGENCIFTYPGSNDTVTKEYIDDVLADFSYEDFLLLQNEISNVDYIVEKAYERGIKIVLNPAPYNEKIDKVDIKKLYCIIFNEVEAMGFTGKENSKEIIEYMRANYPGVKVVLTLGRKGCIYFDDENCFYQSAFKTKAVDTTAAGATFIGYFISAITKGMLYSEAIRIACAASAIAVSRKGAAPSVPCEAEVKQALLYMEEITPDKKGKIRRIKEQIFKYIEENIADASLFGLSCVLGYSEVYTGDLVKRIIGKSFSKAVQDMRCEYSAELLEHTDMTVQEIIYKAGYRNESFFRQLFKEKYGKSPFAYRKEKRESKQNIID